MLVSLVRDSVLQCFCHTCRAPASVGFPVAAHRRPANPPVKKPKSKARVGSKQQKKVKFIKTEIRCQESRNGGVAYEVILADPVVSTPPQPTAPPARRSPDTIAAEDIEEKLKAAKLRRQSLEAGKLSAVAARLSRIEAAARKKDENTTQFILQTREALATKMDSHEEKREANIAFLKSKLKEHLESVEKTRLSLDQQTEEVRTAVEEKLKTAQAHRDENLRKMVERLKEHEEQVIRKRASMQEKLSQLESQIQSKLEHAEARRSEIENVQREKLLELERRAEAVRQNKERIQAAEIASSG